jgi:hypothetical protein
MSFFSSLFSGLNSSGSSNTPPKVYLQCNGSRIQFPVGPSSFEVTAKQNNSIVNINNIGELNMLGKTALLTMSLSSFFPNQSYTFCACTPDDPYSYVKTIDNWRTSGKPSRFIISGTPINYAVSIDSFKWGEKDGTGDVHFSLDFHEYKFVGGAKDSTQVNSVTGLKDRSYLENVAQNITVYPNDSIGDVIGRAVGKTEAANTNSSLKYYTSIAKGGGLKTGSIVTYATGVMKVNGKNV